MGRTTTKLNYHPIIPTKRTRTHSHTLLAPLRYPSVKNSEGVVLWTHEVGSGLVAPNSENREQRTSVADAGSGDGAGIEVREEGRRRRRRRRTFVA